MEDTIQIDPRLRKIVRDLVHKERKYALREGRKRRGGVIPSKKSKARKRQRFDWRQSQE